MSLTDRCQQEQLALLVSLIPLMCECCEDPAVRDPLDALGSSAQNREARDALCRALAAHPRSGELAALLLDAPAPRPDEAEAALSQCLGQDMLGYLYVCRQCTAQELLSVLHRCTLPPGPDALALLVGESRRSRARELYALQLLWRLLGDESLPDPLSLFRETAPDSPDAAAIRTRLIDRISTLKGGTPDE